MASYSIDLREQVIRTWDASGDADAVAATFAVSRAWVHRLLQRRLDTGLIVPWKQTKVSLAGLGRPGSPASGFRQVLRIHSAANCNWNRQFQQP